MLDQSCLALAFLSADQIKGLTPSDSLHQNGEGQNGEDSNAQVQPQGAVIFPQIFPQVLPQYMAQRSAPPPAQLAPQQSTIPIMLTIKELANECKGYGISEHYIRYAAKRKLFPSISTGTKILINKDIFIQHLNGVKFD